MFGGMAELLGRRKSSPTPLIQRDFLFRPGCMEREWRVSHDPPFNCHFNRFACCWIAPSWEPFGLDSLEFTPQLIDVSCRQY